MCSPFAAQATGHRAASAQAVKYTVRPGDTLSAIAGRVYHNSDAWPVLYWANHSQIRWANMISAGQVLKVPAKPAKIPSAPGELGPAAPAPTLAPPAPAEATAATPAYAPAASAVAPAASYSGGTPGGSFGQCVVARESGGNSQVMNSSGHYGLYQFSEGTWVAYGGSAAASATPAWPSRTRCSPTRWPRAASPTGPPTTAADAHQRTRGMIRGRASR